MEFPNQKIWQSLKHFFRAFHSSTRTLSFLKIDVQFMVFKIVSKFIWALYCVKTLEFWIFLKFTFQQSEYDEWIPKIFTILQTTWFRCCERKMQLFNKMHHIRITCQKNHTSLSLTRYLVYYVVDILYYT